LFNGKRLTGDADSLSEAGVTEGDKLNCVPSKKSSSTKKSSSKTKATATPAASADTASAAGASSDPMAEMMKGLTGAGGLDEMVKNMMSGAGGGAGGPAPDMAESMKMMKDLTNSPIFEEFLNNPDKLEESRQMILSNPMMKAMMASMPGMEDLLNDKDAWAQTMTAAAGLMKQMDPEDMMKMMEAQGMGGAGGMPPGMGGAGLFDGATTSSALDELSEGED
jgi:hypothetical protein